MDWNNFTPQEFIAFCKDIFIDIVLPKFHEFEEALYNISTWLEELITKNNIRNK